MNPIQVISTQEPNVLQIRFFPTDICNFNCSYCFPGSHDDIYRYPKDIDTLVKNFRLVFDMYTAKLNKTKFHLMVVGGGEPTIWPKLEQFCEEIKKNHNVYITLITNGSRSLRWWDDNSKFFDGVNLSCHHEFVDIDHYINVADLLFSKGIKVNSLVLMDAMHWDKCVANIEKMKSTSKYPWFIESKEIVQSPGRDIHSYTEEQIEFVTNSIKRFPDGEWILNHFDEFRTHESIVIFDDNTTFPARAHSIIVNKWNQFEGWHCNVALETLLIKADGSVIGSCQTPIFNNTSFNIFSKTFEQDFNTNIEFGPVICPHKLCNCQPESHVSKRKFS